MRLATKGRHIIDAATGQPLLLRGVNMSGIEYLRKITREELHEAVVGWNCDIVRIPFVQSKVANIEYVDELRQVVQWLWVMGSFAILDLQWLSAESGVAPEPNLGSIACWETLAHAFNDAPYVIFDLLNEPHDVPAKQWVEWAYLLTDTVRAVDPERVVMVGGLDWAYDLRGVHLDLPNVIYSTHVYPNKGKQWDRCFGDFAWEKPVFAGEFGGWDEDLDWGRELLAYFDARQMGWTAWSWRDKPHLLGTPFGELVKSALAGAQSKPPASST
ncbi:MAG: glycoside hydrolase family 5 protein [Acidobacteria bacterium]|nr:glycoside hydrolase family 5 protein [Acidobacteriota bacterium]